MIAVISIQSYRKKYNINGIILSIRLAAILNQLKKIRIKLYYDTSHKIRQNKFIPLTCTP